MTQFSTYDEMQQQREQQGATWPGVRAQGSRLEPGELSEIEVTAGRGEPPTSDQVLGLIETINALSARIATRYQEVQELRAQLRDQVAITGTTADQHVAQHVQLREELTTVTAQRDAAYQEVRELRARFGEIEGTPAPGAPLDHSACIQEINRIHAELSELHNAAQQDHDRIENLSRRAQYSNTLLAERMRELSAIERLVMSDLPLDDIVHGVQQVIREMRGQKIDQHSGRQEPVGFDAATELLSGCDEQA